MTHLECISMHIDAELAKRNLEIKCLNAATEKSDPKCKMPINGEDILSIMTQKQYDKMLKISIE